jgi:hypothetical protein
MEPLKFGESGKLQSADSLLDFSLCMQMTAEC